MEIQKCRVKAKCDFYGCNNLASYSFSTKGLIKRDLAFCEDCLNGMYQEIAKMKTPKGTQSPFKLNKRIRREND